MTKIQQVMEDENFLVLARTLTEAGLPAIDVATKLGISERTYHDWMLTGRQHMENEKKSGFSMFYSAIKDAKAAFVHNNLVVIRQQSLNNWQAAAWLLERRRPKEFAKVEKQYTSSNPIPNEYENMTDDQLIKEMGHIVEGLNALRGNKDTSSGD